METADTPKSHTAPHRMLKKMLLVLSSLVLMLLIALLLLVIWVATGPRSLEQFTPQITQSINERLNGYHIELGDIQLAWDSWESPLDMRFTKVKLFSDHNNKLLADLNAVAVSASVWEMLRGQLVLDRVTLYSPTINIYHKPYGGFMLDLGQDTTYGPEMPPQDAGAAPIQPLAHYLKDANLPTLLGLTDFNVRGGTLNLGDTTRGILATFHNVRIETDISMQEVEIDLSAEIKNEDEAAAGALQLSAVIPMETLAARANAKVRDVNPAFIALLHPSLAVLKGVDLPLDGGISLALNEKGIIYKGKFQLSTRAGTLSNEYIAQAMNITSAELRGQITAPNTISIDELSLVMDATIIEGRAKLTQNEAGQSGIWAQVALNQLETDRVKFFWPPAQSPVSREWVTTNITGGMITGASITVNIKPGQLELPQLPNETVDARLTFEGASVKFQPEFDRVTNASGSVHINANELNVAIDQGRFMEQVSLSKGRVFIDSLVADNPDIRVAFNLTAPAKIMAQVLANPVLDVAKDVNMNSDTISGDVTGAADITFPYELPRDASGKPDNSAITYDIKAKLNNVSQPEFLEDYDITGATGDLHVTSQQVSFKGTGAIFTTPLTMDITHQLRGSDSVRSSIKASGEVSDEFLRRMEVDLAPYVTGSLTANAHINLMADDSVQVEATTELGKAEVNVQELAWKKPAGVAASLNVVAVQSAKGVEISSLEFASGQDMFDGSLSLDAAGELAQITATKLVLGNNNLQLSFAPIQGGYKIYAQGTYFDVSRFLEDDKDKDGKKDNFSFKDIPALDVIVDVKRLVMKDGRYIDNLVGKALCNPKICTNVAISGNLQGAKPVVMAIVNQQGRRHLKVTSDDAGSLLRGLNIYENMEGGKLDIEGVFNDQQADSPLLGKVVISNFSVNNTPILARIVTLASFGGILDAISGSGLTFDRLRSEFTLLNDVIDVKAMRATGGSLGITADGEVNLKNNTIFVKGTVIPSYTINSMLKNVPIVGQILTGGEAIIAANYKVSGDMDEAEVSVNPLSALAPGFLRNIFE